MLPVVLDVARCPILLAGNGAAAARRLAQLDEAGAGDVLVFAADPTDGLRTAAGARLRERAPNDEDIARARLVFLVGLDGPLAKAITATARRFGALVNTEDSVDLCDFHTPAVVRRGDLTIAVSTAGKSPRLARRIRAYLEGVFGAEWSGRLEELALERARWRVGGASGGELSRRTDRVIDGNGWLK